ncbi:hypothetical protein GCM10027091_10180 [Streptomyces daliensis]
MFGAVVSVALAETEWGRAVPDLGWSPVELEHPVDAAPRNMATLIAEDIWTKELR